jgi:hypothetical protein
MKVFCYAVHTGIVETGVITEICDANDSDINFCRLKDFFVTSLHIIVYCALIILISFVRSYKDEFKLPKLCISRNYLLVYSVTIFQL